MSIKKFTISFFILLIIISIIAICYFFIKNPSSPDDNNINTENAEIPEISSIKNSLIVADAKHLEIVGIYINSNDTNYSTVSAKIKNNSNEICENIVLCISLLDKNNEIITSLDCKISKIEPNKQKITSATLPQDLSMCENYSVSLNNGN